MSTTELNAVSRDKLLSDLKILMADADEYLRTSAGQAREAYAAARTRLAAASRELADKTQTAARAADGYVHKNPWQSIALGAGVGLLLGLLIGRR